MFKALSKAWFERVQSAFIVLQLFLRQMNFLKMLFLLFACAKKLVAFVKFALDLLFRMIFRNMLKERSSAKKTFVAINTLNFFHWFCRLVNFENVLVSFFLSVEISWTFRWKIALDGDVFVVVFHVLRLAFFQHFLAVNTLIAVFLVDFSNVFQLVFVGKKISDAVSVEVALDGLRFVVQWNMCGQVSDHLFAVDA